MSLRLDGQKVVIIGGSAGMGLATAELAVDQGAELVVAARSADRLSAAVASLTNRGGRQVGYSTLSIEDRPTVARFLAQHAPFDHLVLPGSTVVPRRYEELDQDNASAAFASKFWGPFWTVFDARPHMRRGGSVVLYSGVAADRPVRGFVVGSAINGALNALTRSLALELADQGLRINTIAPGPVATPLWERVDHGASLEEIAQLNANRLPVGRVGTAHDCALAALLLMLNGFVTGEVLGVDGGLKSLE